MTPFVRLVERAIGGGLVALLLLAPTALAQSGPIGDPWKLDATDLLGDISGTTLLLGGALALGVALMGGFLLGRTRIRSISGPEAGGSGIAVSPPRQVQVEDALDSVAPQLIEAVETAPGRALADLATDLEVEADALEAVAWELDSQGWLALREEEGDLRLRPGPLLEGAEGGTGDTVPTLGSTLLLPLLDPGVTALVVDGIGSGSDLLLREVSLAFPRTAYYTSRQPRSGLVKRFEGSARDEAIEVVDLVEGRYGPLLDVEGSPEDPGSAGSPLLPHHLARRIDVAEKGTDHVVDGLEFWFEAGDADEVVRGIRMMALAARRRGARLVLGVRQGTLGPREMALLENIATVVVGLERHRADPRPEFRAHVMKVRNAPHKVRTVPYHPEGDLLVPSHPGRIRPHRS